MITKHDDPKIFDDFLAHHMFTEQGLVYMEHNLAESLKFFDPERAASCPDRAAALALLMRITMSVTVSLSRARYTEDSLEIAIEQGVRQYVILGAGMDTFAFRKPEIVRELQVFEVDHPATQGLKRNRLAELGWKIPDQLHFIPVDFMKDDLAEALNRSLYDPQELTLFSWLGVTYYLTPEVVFDTLRSIADIAPAGSSIIFDYLDTDAFDPEKASKRIRQTQEIVRNAGEPMKAGFNPYMLANDLKSIGLRLHESLSPLDIEERYIKRRTDGYHAFEHVHLALAVVNNVA